MLRQRSQVVIKKDAKVNEAACAYKKNKYKSIQKAADAFGVPYSTLKHRLVGRKTRVQSHEK